MQSTTNVFELILPITSISNVQIPIKENVQYSSLDLPFLSAIAPPPNAAIGLTYYAATVTKAPAVAAIPKREVAYGVK